MADGRDAVDVDVRLMAGAEASPDTWVADGHLREDLYERLAALRIDVPPLRRRREDIPPLAVHFLRSACAGAGVPVKGLSRSAMTLLSALPWPGNARDLRSLIETLMHAVGPSVIQLEDVLAHASLEGGSARIDTGMTLRDARARFEHGLYQRGPHQASRSGGRGRESARDSAHQPVPESASAERGAFSAGGAPMTDCCHRPVRDLLVSNRELSVQRSLAAGLCWLLAIGVPSMSAASEMTGVLNGRASTLTRVGLLTMRFSCATRKPERS